MGLVLWQAALLFLETREAVSGVAGQEQGPITMVKPGSVLVVAVAAGKGRRQPPEVMGLMEFV